MSNSQRRAMRIKALDILENGIVTGVIMMAPQSSPLDTATMIASVVRHLTRRIGTPSDGEIVSLGKAIGQKLAGAASDTDAAFAGRALVVTDSEEGDDFLEVHIGKQIYTFEVDWVNGEMRILLS